MPYITQQQRKAIAEWEHPKDPGELNYLITMYCNLYLDETDKKYDDYNTIIGVLECAKLELYRRMVAPYEDVKKQLNGDVYSV